jgi:hypothetical protein
MTTSLPMMSEQNNSSSRWAILIGANVHDNANHPPKGIEGDIIAINQFLSTCVPPVKVTTLLPLSTSLKQPAFSGTPFDTATYDNTINYLKTVINQSRRHDRVYIHYSGHGTRRKGDGALALVLHDPGPQECKYLYGDIIRSAIDRMMDKGLHVTLVLDCCFSGAILRAGQRSQLSSPRYMEYNSEIDSISDDGNVFARRDEMRDASFVLPRGSGSGQRLLDPAGYAILSASDLHEETHEVMLEDGSSRGALSYFMLESLAALRKRGVQTHYRTLYQDLQARFHAHHSKQTPKLYGLSQASFFDELHSGQMKFTASAYRSINGSLVLTAGEAHGVHVGDNYELYPFESQSSSHALEDHTRIGVHVKSVDYLSSNLEVLNTFDNDHISIDTTWAARMLNSFSPHHVRVYLDPSVANPGELIQGLRKDTFLAFVQANDETENGAARSMFNVQVKGDSEYVIHDSVSKQVANLPKLCSKGDTASRSLLVVLEHIAMYKFFEQIENSNPTPQFEASFSLASKQREPELDGYFIVPDYEDLTLTFANLDSVAKYVTVINFSDFWEVSNLVWDSGEGECITIPAGNKANQDGNLDLDFRMEVPPHARERQLERTEDIIKVFITDKPTRFPAVILPRIDEEAMRGDPTSRIERLEDIIWGLSGLRGGDDVQGSWSTRTFLVRTVL